MLMKVITEDTIRRQFRSKQLWEKATLEVAADALITPSAQSYLREHHIRLIHETSKQMNKKVRSSKNENNRIQKRLSDDLDPQHNFMIQAEIRHLANLLYFPLLSDSCFPSEWWNYFTGQQLWLRKFADLSEKNSSVIALSAPAAFHVCTENYRVWSYSLQEIIDQIHKIQCLLIDKKNSKIFNDWSKNLLKVIQSPEEE